METHTIPGAASWASYLINGDDSGLDDDERTLADAWLEQNGIAEVLSCGDEPYFSHYYWLHTGSKYTAGDLLDYTVTLLEGE